jgi:hypothetical protein
MVTETKRPKPSVIDVSEELGFSQQRLPEVGPGSHKPNLGRGGVALSEKYYLGEPDLKVTEKKGDGIAAPVKKAQPSDTSKPKWSDIA